MSTLFEGRKGIDYYINYEKKETINDLIKIKRFIQVGYINGINK